MFLNCPRGKKEKYLKLQNPATLGSYYWHLTCSLLPLKLALFVLVQHLTRGTLINSNLNKQECLKQTNMVQAVMLHSCTKDM